MASDLGGVDTREPLEFTTKEIIGKDGDYVRSLAANGLGKATALHEVAKLVEEGDFEMALAEMLALYQENGISIEETPSGTHRGTAVKSDGSLVALMPADWKKPGSRLMDLARLEHRWKSFILQGKRLSDGRIARDVPEEVEGLVRTDIAFARAMKLGAQRNPDPRIKSEAMRTGAILEGSAFQRLATFLPAK